MSWLNVSLATTALAVWGGSYALFFARDLRRWWRNRHARRQRQAAMREQAIRAYAAWVRNIPPPRSRAPILPAPLPIPVPPAARAPRRSAVVVPFPQGRRAEGR